MRVTSASASANSLAARAARRALCEATRSEPGMTRILGVRMSDDRKSESEAEVDREKRESVAIVSSDFLILISEASSSRRYTHTRAGGIFIQMRSDASTEKPPSRFGNGAAIE